MNMYNPDKTIFNLSTKHLPFEYKWLEFRLIVNKELYDKKIIDLKIFKAMEQSLLSRITKIKNENKDKIKVQFQKNTIYMNKQYLMI